MICDACKAAGRLMSLPKQKVKKAKALHDQCPGGTRCDCQHRVDAVTIVQALPR